MTGEIERVAKGLTKAQRECVLSAEQVSRGEMQVWSNHRGTIKSVYAKGLCSAPSYLDTATETPLGLAVRRHLQEKAHD